MNVRRKLGTAISLLKREGLGALFKEAGRRYLGTGSPRPDEAEIVFDALKSRPGPCVMIDVGAHFGSALKPFAASGWKIFAFEPDPKNREKLQAAFGASSNVVIDSRGISDTPRESVPFFTSDVSTGISGLSAFHSSHVASGTIDLTTLEDVCAKNNIGKIDFLKIDTEGFDLFVLKGVPWDKLAPAVILCEFENSKTLPLGYSFHDLATFLAEKGYRLIISEWHPIKKYGGLHDWRRFVQYPSRLKEDRSWGNILAARSDTLFDALVSGCNKYGAVESRDASA